MAGVLGAASIPFIGCVTLLCGMILQILAVAAPFWARDDMGEYGLWRRHVCLQPDDLETDDTNYLRKDWERCYKYNHRWFMYDWFEAVRAMECITIISWAIPLVVVPVYIYVALGLYYRSTLGVMTIFTLLGFVTNVIGFIIFGVKIDENNESVEWCYILSVIASAFGLLTVIVFIVATIKRPRFAPESRIVSGYYVYPDRNQLYVIEADPYKDGGSVIDTSHVNPVLVTDD